MDDSEKLDVIKLKQNEFNQAMVRYETIFFFQNIGLFVSIGMAASQLYAGYLVSKKTYSFRKFLIIFCLAYVFADLINGIVHLWADNNNNYSNICYGPLIAAFHLHHKKPKYNKNHFLKVYFNENGSKIWLFVAMILYISVGHKKMDKNVSLMFVLFSYLSSFAEISHYLCHNSTNSFVKYLQRCGILLNPQIHRKHHQQDNINYTFLNGCTDFIVNYIARKWYKGYKNRADLHSQLYTGQTGNRSN